MSGKTKNKEENVQSLDQEELKIIEQRRERNELLKKCSNEIVEVLTKYNATLSIDPSSPISNPAIKIILK